jgi:hypothetical protein
MKTKIIILLLGLAIIFCAWQLWPKQKKPPTDQLTEIASTNAGDLRGFVQDGLNIYLGIPYAQPPTG